MILRFLNLQGILGLAAAAILSSFLGMARIDAGHWKRQSTRFEQLYRGEVASHAETIAAVRAARERAHAEDNANAKRVRDAQTLINQRTADDLETRLADARHRARAQRLRQQPQAPAGDSGRAGPAMPGLPAAPGDPDHSTAQDRFPRPALGDDDALLATEQAIQLDELIQWVRAQAAIDVGDHRR
ncbi:MAG: hypothetical protein ABIO29_04880 [Sphingomicrobium sp.]